MSRKTEGPRGDAGHAGATRTHRRVTDAEVARVVSNMGGLTRAEEEAVEEGVRRTMAIWEQCDTGQKVNRFRSPEGRPSAEEVVDALSCGWKRRISLLDLILVKSAQRAGVPLGTQQPKSGVA